MDNWLENFWAEILSREPARIQVAIATIEDDDEQREAIITHLRRMTTEEGWLGPQRISAQAALDALGITD